MKLIRSDLLNYAQAADLVAVGLTLDAAREASPMQHVPVFRRRDTGA